MSGRPGEVRLRWAAKRLGLCDETIRRWCKDVVSLREVGADSAQIPLRYVRVEYGARQGDGVRHVKRYWLLRSEIEDIAADGVTAAAS